MKLSALFNSIAILGTLATETLATTAPKARKNQMVGIYKMSSAHLYINNTLVSTEALGPNPNAHLIITADFYAMAQIQRSDLPLFPADLPRGQPGSPEQNAAIVQGTLAITGTYEVDEDGVWLSQHVLGCSYPNWVGLERGREGLAFEVREGGLTETLTEGQQVSIVQWERVSTAKRGY